MQYKTDNDKILIKLEKNTPFCLQHSVGNTAVFQYDITMTS